MHIHILGIGGSFMGGLAVLAQQAGHRVTGCDKALYPPMSLQLIAQGIDAIEGYGSDQLKLKPDVYVIGNVISRGNPLVEEILDRNLPYISGPQWLKENVLKDKWVLAVAGTHGKTTTASMLAWILEYARMAPGFLIGGIPQNFSVSARLASSSFFVIEADEYDTAFFDKRSKFLHYAARTAIFNNLEFDHADIFPDLAAIETQFHYFARLIPKNGLIISNARDANLQRVLARGMWSQLEYFANHDGWNCAPNGDALPVYFKDQAQGELRWQLQGKHNQHNALAAIAAARHVGVPPAIAVAALGEFKNVKRRMELRGTVRAIQVYDDFAHHPTAIATTLEGLRRHTPGQRILAVIEPRSATMKMGVMKDRLAESLQLADRIFCYSDNLEWDVAAALAPLKSKAQTYTDLPKLISAVVSTANPGDQIVVMSNGGFGGIHEKLLDGLAAHTEPIA